MRRGVAHVNDDPTEAPPKSGRREFLDYLVGASGLGFALLCLGSVLGYLRPPKATAGSGAETVEVGADNDFPVGTGKTVDVNAAPVLVIHLADRWIALSAVCTHLGCLVHYDPGRKQIICPCHAGVYDLNGNVVAGPPPRALKEYNIQDVAGEILVRSA
jgi:cytochrome b6-f complex iron-sulfur subunit